MSELARVTFDNDGGQGVVDVVRDEQRGVYLTIGGKTAFELTPDTCDTCQYVFTKLMPAEALRDGAGDEAARHISDSLRDVHGRPPESLLRDIGAVLSPGRYTVVLVELTPQLTLPGDPLDYFAHEAPATWGLDPYFGVPHAPKTPYYRLGAVTIDRVAYGGSRLGVVLGVPLHPPTRVGPAGYEAVERYRSVLREGTTRPTALALGLVDDRGPAVWEKEPQFSRHLIVTLHLLDGHHKVAAAAAEQRPLQFLVYFPQQYLGRHQKDMVDRAVKLLRLLAAEGTPDQP